MTRESSATQLFVLTFALVFYGMGASFVESFVNYPTWQLVGANEFREFHQAVGRLIIRFMVIPLMITTLMTIALLWRRPAPIPRWMVALAIALQAVAWVSTVMIQLPIQGQLSNGGPSLPLIEQLMVSNWWLRRIPNLVNAALFLWMMSLVLGGTSRPAGTPRPAAM